MASKKPVAGKPVAKEPIPAKYAGMPEDVARAMMRSDAGKAEREAAFAKAVGKGTVTGNKYSQPAPAPAPKPKLGKAAAEVKRTMKEMRRGVDALRNSKSRARDINRIIDES